MPCLLHKQSTKVLGIELVSMHAIGSKSAIDFGLINHAVRLYNKHKLINGLNCWTKLLHTKFSIFPYSGRPSAKAGKFRRATATTAIRCR